MMTMTRTELKDAIATMQDAADRGEAKPSTLERLALYKAVLDNPAYEVKSGGNGRRYIVDLGGVKLVGF